MQYHSESLLFNLVVCLAAALLCGGLAIRVRLSPIVGYLVAGVICGPFTPGYVANPDMAEEMADIGVVLLMFGVGLNFSLHELFSVRRVAVPGAIIQSLVTTCVVTTLSHLLGLAWLQGIIVGLAFSVASTALLARMLTDNRQLSTPGGRLAMGWLVVEDIFTVIVLIVLPMLAVDSTQTQDGWVLAREIGLAMGKVAVLAVLVGFFGVRYLPRLLSRLSHSSELFNLAVPVMALGIAWVAATVFDVSLALGSFLAGVIAGQAKVGDKVETTLAPLRDPFAALFFLSIGTLLDPGYVAAHPLGLLFALGVILLVKPMVALLLMWGLKQPLHTALVVAIGLGQVGEFSFILIHQANLLNLLPADSGHLLVAAAIISIAINPFLFKLLPKIEKGLGRLKWFKA
jgi:monovalent cation:H+ antiporter-2, CPA2 family